MPTSLLIFGLANQDGSQAAECQTPAGTSQDLGTQFPSFSLLESRIFTLPGKYRVLKDFWQILSWFFALSCPSGSLILIFYPSAVGAVRRKVVATGTRLHPTQWSLTGRRWILIFLQNHPKNCWFSLWMIRGCSSLVICRYLPLNLLFICHLGVWTKLMFIFKWNSVMFFTKRTNTFVEEMWEEREG